MVAIELRVRPKLLRSPQRCFEVCRAQLVRLRVHRLRAARVADHQVGKLQGSRDEHRQNDIDQDDTEAEAIGRVKPIGIHIVFESANRGPLGDQPDARGLGHHRERNRHVSNVFSAGVPTETGERERRSARNQPPAVSLPRRLIVRFFAAVRSQFCAPSAVVTLNLRRLAIAGGSGTDLE
jgi:hypothetical protein